MRRGHRQFVDPRHQDIRPTRIRPYHRRSAVIKQVDDVEIIEVEGVLSDQNRRNRVKHQRQRDGTQLSRATGTVHGRRFVQIVRNGLQHAGGHGENKREAEPGLHHN